MFCFVYFQSGSQLRCEEVASVCLFLPLLVIIIVLLLALPSPSLRYRLLVPRRIEGSHGLGIGISSQNWQSQDR